MSLPPHITRMRSTEPLPPWAERLVRFLDDGFVVPGTNFRVGFDAVLGLIPGLGDFVAMASSLSLVWLAHQRNAPNSVLTRMLVNLGVDAVIGAVPVIGDVFDVVYKANRRNLTLLERYTQAPPPAQVNRKGFLAIVIVAAILLLTIPVLLALVIFRLLFD